MHYNQANSYLFINGTENYKFKEKDSEIVATPLCSRNVSKDFFLDKMKKTAVDDILDIHKYLMKKCSIK